MKQDVVSYIKENVDPIALLNYYNFQHISDSQQEIRACCGIHGGNNPSGFVWSKTNNLWACYTDDCGGGDIFTLIQKIEGVSFEQSIEIAAKILGLNIEGMEYTPDDKILQEQKRWLYKQKDKEVPVDNKPYEISFCKKSTTDERFLRFDEEVIKYYDAFFCNVYPDEERLHYNKLVIPIIQDNVCVGVALRDVTGLYKPKWFYIPKRLNIRSILYNFDIAKQYDEIILTEGIFDVWAYHRIGLDNAVAIFGSSLKKEQYEILMQTGADITLSFDGDKAGRLCSHSTKLLLGQKTTVREIDIVSDKDPADLSEDELMKCYKQRKISM